MNDTTATRIPAPAVGHRVVFATPPECFRQYKGKTFTVEVVTYDLGGQMDADTRRAIDGGYAHLVMVDAAGRRVGTTADRVIPAYEATWRNTARVLHHAWIQTDPKTDPRSERQFAMDHEHALAEIVADLNGVDLVYPTLDLDA